MLVNEEGLPKWAVKKPVFAPTCLELVRANHKEKGVNSLGIASSAARQQPTLYQRTPLSGGYKDH